MMVLFQATRLSTDELAAIKVIKLQPSKTKEDVLVFVKVVDVCCQS